MGSRRDEWSGIPWWVWLVSAAGFFVGVWWQWQLVRVVWHGR